MGCLRNWKFGTLPHFTGASVHHLSVRPFTFFSAYLFDTVIHSLFVLIHLMDSINSPTIYRINYTFQDPASPRIT